MKRIVVLMLALLMLVGCTGKKEEPATTTQPAAAEQTSAAQGAAPATTAEPAATPAGTPAAAPVEPPPPPPKPAVLAAGTVITVRIDQSLGSDKSKTGDGFTATTTDPLKVQNGNSVPAGSAVQGTVVEAKAKGKIKGEARLKLALTAITVNGKSYPIESSMLESTAKGKGKRTTATTAGGAGLGAIIGGIAGGGKGAAIGAAVGGGVGFVGGAFTGNKQIELPAETVLSFKLANSVTLE